VVPIQIEPTHYHAGENRRETMLKERKGRIISGNGFIFGAEGSS